jgi:hypothetical protein
MGFVSNVKFYEHIASIFQKGTCTNLGVHFSELPHLDL